MPVKRPPTAIVVALAAAVIVVVAVAAYVGASIAFPRDDTVHQTIAGTRAIVLDVEQGNISVQPAEGDQVEIRVDRRWTWRLPTVSQQIDDGQLEITWRCPAGSGWCRTNVVLSVPAGTDVRVRTTAGDISATGVSVASLTASTRFGSITASFSHPPDSVDLSVHAGDARLAVPDAAYRIEASGAGDTNVNLPNDPTASRVLKVRAATGTVDIDRLA